MVANAIDRLEYLLKIIPAFLLNTDDAALNEKPGAEKWSKKEILGHLIDSATNNHQRFVRVQFEDQPTIAYDQNKWNQYNYYQQIDKAQLIAFWSLYNKQLLEIIKRIPKEALDRTCSVGGKLLTLDFLINSMGSKKTAQYFS